MTNSLAFGVRKAN